MSVTTVTETLVDQKATLVDCRNKLFPFLKDVFIYAYRYNSTDDFDTTKTDFTLVLKGATKILSIYMMKDTAGTFATLVPSSITYGTDFEDVKTTIVADITDSPEYVYVFVVAEI